MKLNSEFRYVMQPHRMRLHWSIFYSALFIIILVILYLIAAQIHTHTQPVGKIYISSPYSKYVVGEPVSFTLVNGYNAPIYITNLCPAEPIAVYRQDGNSWRRLHATADSATCSNQQPEVKVPASSQVTTSMSPWQSLFNQPGNYRLVAVVDGYSSLPYVDIQIVAQPSPIIVKNFIRLPAVRQQTQSTTPTTTTNTDNESTTATADTTTNPATYTLTVNSSGNYSATSITMKSGDILKLVYSPCCGNEVITLFSPIAPTTTSLNSVLLDHDTKTRSITMSTKGTWKYKAKDYSGNSGILTVN